MIKHGFLDDHKSILNNFFHLGIIRFSNVLTKLLLVAYLVRVFGEKIFGTLTWAESILQYFVIFINFGFNTYAAKYIVKYEHNKGFTNSIISSIYIVKLILFLMSFLILYSLTFVDEISKNFNLILLLLVSGLGEVLYPLWYFQGREFLKPISLLIIPIKILLLVLTFLYIKSPEDLMLFVVFFVSSQLLLGAVSSWLLTKYSNYKFSVPKIKLLNSILKKGSMYFFGNVSSVLFNATTIFLIGIFVSMEKVSGFDISLKIVLAFIIPFDMLRMAVFPSLTRTQNENTLKKLIYLSLTAGVVLFLLIQFFSENLISLFGGPEMIKYSYVLKLLSYIILVVPASFNIGQCGLIAFGYDKQFNLSLIISSALYLGMLSILFFTENLNFYSLVITRVLSDIFLVLLRIYYLFKVRIISI